MKRVSRKENLPNERAGEETIGSLEGFQDQIRTISFSRSGPFLANSGDRFDLGTEFREWGDSYGSSLNHAHAALDVALVGLEADVL